VNSVDNGSFIFLLLYMNDMLTATNMKDLSTANKIIGMEIRRDGMSGDCGYLKPTM
jgi:hypothetical protein